MRKLFHRFRRHSSLIIRRRHKVCSLIFLVSKELVGIKIKMKLLTFLFRYKTASATGLGGREIFELYEFTNELILRCLPRSLDNQILLSPSRVSPFVLPKVFSRGNRFPLLSKNVDFL